MKEESKFVLHARIWIAIVLVAFGCFLLTWGCCKPPEGEIHESVLIAFGEILTFSGCLLGIDYAYRVAIEKIKASFKDGGQKREKYKKKNYEHD